MPCFGSRKSRRGDAERQPLLPQYNAETALQARLHEKLHTYQMLRAMSKGYMPTNKQAIIQLRTLLSAQILNPQGDILSPSGQTLVRSSRLWLTQLIDFLEYKNSEDQIQDFIWYLTKARVDVDVAHVEAKASKAIAKADAAATYQSLQTVGSLLLNNSDFRIFLSDLSTVGREVLRDTAFTLADVSKQAAETIEPDPESRRALKQPNGGSKRVPSNKELKEELKEVTEAVVGGAVEVVEEAGESAAEHIRGDEGDALVQRLKSTIINLRQHTDYSDSVSTLSTLIRRYLLTYANAAAEAAQVIEEDAQTNREADRALHNFWLFITSLGDPECWKKLEESFNAMVEAGQADPNFDELVRQVGNMTQDMLMEPDFFDEAGERFQKIRAKSNQLSEKSSIRSHVETFLDHLESALRSVLNDTDIRHLLRTTKRIAGLISPPNKYANNELLSDTVNIFIPLAIQAVQFIPIPRLEVASPAVDLLIENLILEPGRTINHTSFLPFKLKVSTQNDVEVCKARFGTTSTMTSLLNITVSGMSIAADDLGYWLHLHSGILRLMDEGLAGFSLDERGIDISLDIEIGRDRLEEILVLRNVKVCIHKLNYKLAKSKFACLAWLLKPFVRPILKKTLEAQIEASIAEGLRALNRELLYARERLRAARIANPNDLWTFARAVLARLVPARNPDIDTRVGIKAGKGVFRGRYAPGSLVQLWEEEAQQAEQRVYEYQRDGWKNDIFDVKTRLV